MCEVGDSYIYNLQGPNTAAVGEEFTVRMRPFGDGNTEAVLTCLDLTPVGGQTRVLDVNADAKGDHSMPGATPRYPPEEFKREAL